MEFVKTNGKLTVLEDRVVLYVIIVISCHNYHRCTSQSKNLTLVHLIGSVGYRLYWLLHVELNALIGVKNFAMTAADAPASQKIW